MPELPDVVTVPGVELVAVGSWEAAHGDGTITADDLDAMVAAAADPEVDQAPVRIGHTDPTYDGSPALGWLTNVRRAGDRLLADLEGVPRTLAPRLRDAWRRRSIEAVSDLTTPSGRRYRRALTGLALLGITAPAVKGLADIAALYATAGRTVGRHDLIVLSEETPMTPKELRTLIGLAEDASEEELRARLAELVALDAKSTSDQVPKPPPSTAETTLAAQNTDLRRQLADHTVTAAAAQRDQVLFAAVRDGKISPYERNSIWEPLYAADAAHATTQLAALPANRFPVHEIGDSGEDDGLDDTYDLMMAARGFDPRKDA